MTILCGFIENLLRVRAPTYDDKQEKRIRHMKKEGISNKNTVCLLSSNIIKKPDSVDAEEKLKRVWTDHLNRSAKISNVNFTVGHGLSYLHFT